MAVCWSVLAELRVVYIEQTTIIVCSNRTIGKVSRLEFWFCLFTVCLLCLELEPGNTFVVDNNE